MTKWGENFVYGGRIVLALIVGLVIGNGLRMNPYFYKDPITPWLLGIFGAVLCFVLMQTLLAKK